jgi:hypothetical protein
VGEISAIKAEKTASDARLASGQRALPIPHTAWATTATAATFSPWTAPDYGLATPESWHMHQFLEQVLPGFKWLTWTGFAIGLVESFLYGAYAGIVYVPIHNFLQRRLGAD